MNSEERNQYIEDIKKALKAVSPSYVIPNNSGGYNERIFAYEFYHQYRLIMTKDDDKKKYYLGKYLSGEQSKIYELNEQDKRTAPDIVLSANVEEVEADKQFWVAEIKMLGNKELLNDIPKLDNLMRQLSFSIKVFICVGLNKADLQTLLGKAKKTDTTLEVFCCTVIEDTQTLDVQHFTY